MDITWKEGRLVEFRLQSDHAKKYRILYGTRSAEVQLGRGKAHRHGQYSSQNCSMIRFSAPYVRRGRSMTSNKLLFVVTLAALVATRAGRSRHR